MQQDNEPKHTSKAQEKLNEGFGVAKSKSGIKSDWKM